MGDPETRELAPVRAVFRAVARTVVPRAGRLDAAGWAELESVVEGALGDRPPAMRRQLRLLLRAVEWLPVLRWGRRFTRLPPDRRRRVLEAFQDAPLLLARRGFWGLRTLVFMGYYGREAAREEIGYDARLRGRRQKEEATRGRGRGELPAGTPGAPPDPGSPPEPRRRDDGPPGVDAGDDLPRDGPPGGERTSSGRDGGP